MRLFALAARARVVPLRVGGPPQPRKRGVELVGGDVGEAHAEHGRRVVVLVLLPGPEPRGLDDLDPRVRADVVGALVDRVRLVLDKIADDDPRATMDSLTESRADSDAIMGSNSTRAARAALAT